MKFIKEPKVVKQVVDLIPKIIQIIGFHHQRKLLVIKMAVRIRNFEC